MTNLKCTRCQSEFYTAISGKDIACPFCGFLFKVVEHDLRADTRSTIQRDCLLTGGEHKVFAKTVDISQSGIGIRMKGSLPFEKDETVHAVVKDFDIKGDAQIMWLKRYNSSGTKIGLRFC